MADEKKVAKQYDSIIDTILDYAPDWKALDMQDAKASGDEWLDRTHEHVDKSFEDDISESVNSKHTPIWGQRSGSHTYEDRIAEKEAASPRVNAVKADWRKDARRDQEAYGTEMGDNESLIAEVTMTLEKAQSNNNLAENSAAKKEVTDAQIQKYVKDLLNQGMAPSKVAAKLVKLAEIELFNHQSATDYLQRNAGLLGLSYLEPNSMMPKNSPTYEHTASKKTAWLPTDENEYNAMREERESFPTSETEWDAADAKQRGIENPEQAWVLSDRDVWHRNPAYQGPPVPHPEDYDQEYDAHGNTRSSPDYTGDVENNFPKDSPNITRQKNSNACVQQKRAWDNSGIKPQAKSVKQINACEGCSYFKKSLAGKTCNLYHLPVVANTQELTQIVNHLTPGVPIKQKHAALVAIANGEDKQVKNATIARQTNIVKAPDAKVANQSKRASYEFSDKREISAHFESSHVAKLHDKNVSLKEIYKWATGKFGDVETSFAFRGFVQSFKKDPKGKVIIASADLNFLNSIGIRNENYQSAAKCASCPTHFNREAREIEQNRGAQRVDQKFASSTVDAARNKQTQTKEIFVTAGKVRKLHQAGHSIEKIYNGAANKVGSVRAKKAVAGFIEDFKKAPGKIAVSEADRAFMIGKLGFKPEAIRMLDPLRRPVAQVVAAVPEGQNILSYPGMGKQARTRKTTDGHALLNEFDLSASQEMQDIGTNQEPYDVEMGSKFRLDE